MFRDKYQVRWTFDDAHHEDPDVDFINFQKSSLKKGTSITFGWYKTSHSSVSILDKRSFLLPVYCDVNLSSYGDVSLGESRLGTPKLYRLGPEVLFGCIWRITRRVKKSKVCTYPGLGGVRTENGIFTKTPTPSTNYHIGH